jgi:hypothetical protein
MEMCKHTHTHTQHKSRERERLFTDEREGRRVGDSKIKGDIFSSEHNWKFMSVTFFS